MDIGGVDDWVKYYRSVSVQTLNEQSQLRQNGIMVGMSRADWGWKYTFIRPFIFSFDHPSISYVKRSDKWNFGQDVMTFWLRSHVDENGKNVNVNLW